MKVFTILRLLVLSSFFLFHHVVASEPTNATEIEDAPECAIECFSRLVDPPTFSDLNKERLCHHKPLSKAAFGCILVKCSIRDLFDFLKLEQSTCRRPELDNDHKIRGVVYTILGIAVISVALRIVVKSRRFSQWGPDDYLIIAAAVFTVIQCIVMGLMTFDGLGRNIWIFNDRTITTFFKYLLVVQYTYVLSLCLVKLSILFFFLRTFPDHTFRTLVKWTIGFNILTTIIFSICGALQRQPVYLLWEGWKEYPPRGKTLNIPAIIFSHAGVNIALDIWMFVLPLTQLYHLGLQPKKKAGVMLIFGVGIFLIAASCIRIPYLLSFSKSLNATSDSQGFIVWSNVESGVGIMVACMPSMQPLFRSTAAKLRSWNILPSRKRGSGGIFVERSLASIKLTRTDGTTLVGADDMVLNDQGGLLTLTEPMPAKKVYQKAEFVSDTGTSRSRGSEEGYQN